MAIDELEPLITEEPDPTHGYPIQLEAVDGEWRFAVQLADPTDPYAEWLDLTQFYLGDRHQRGADQPKGRYAASVTRVDLQIDEVMANALGVDINILAPWGQDTTELFGVDVTLDAGLLMRAGVFSVVGGYTETWYPLWTGRVESWGDDSRARGQIRTHTVTVVDLLSDLANVPTVIVSNDIPADEYATENLEGAGWLFGFDYFGDTAIGFLQDLTAAPAINRLDAVADPSGLVWRTRRNGVMIMYPPPWDTTNTARWTSNPLEAAYPGGVVFSYAPSTSEVEYAADDDAQPFGVSRSIAGVLNTFAVTSPGPVTYDPSDPVSQARYGYRPFTATWIVDNDAAVDDLLADRAFMSLQALPLRTQIDMDGFFPALALLDHLDPVTVVHATLEDHSTVTVVGVVRNIVEERTFRFLTDDATAGALSWQSTVQMDIDSTETAAALLPVEDLALVSAFTPGFGGPSGAEFSWTNPTQPDVTPTNLQIRVLGKSPIWVDIDYPGTGADGVTVNWLAAATAYTFEVRIIRRVNGIITHASPVRSLNFVTPANIVPFPIPGDDPTDTNGEFPQPEDPCDDFEVELQESDDGVTWTTIDSFTGTELEDNGDGTYSLAVDIPNSTFDDDKVYRFRTTCDGATWTNGTSFDPPDDWTDPCVIPPGLSNFPFTDPGLLVYVPKICAPDIIREAISGIEGVKGDAFAGFGVVAGDPDYRSLLAIDTGWEDTPGGIVAYGECPQIVGAVRDKSIHCRVNLSDAENCVLMECGAMTLSCVELTAGYRVTVTVYKVGSTVTLTSSAIFSLDTEYTFTGTHDYETGDIKLLVDYVEDNSVGGTDNVETVEALPIWRVGAPPGGSITDCAFFDTVIASIVQPSGGDNIADVGLYRIHAFHTNGTFDPGSFTGITYEWLIVGGGGGGGCTTRGGGGGGGEVLTGSGTITAPEAVTVGAAGAGAVENTSNSTAGGNSSFKGTTANGGGRGGGTAGSVGGSLNGGNGGNGGGGMGGAAGVSGTGGTGDQFNGGTGNGSATGAQRCGGGGGGAGGAGENAGTDGTGFGGDGGLSVQWARNSNYYGGGGGGAGAAGGSTGDANSGAGNGGQGTPGNGTNASIANRGAGGGGGLTQGGNGAAGIVAVAYLISDVTP